MKRLFGIFISVLLLCSLIGCGQTPRQKNEDDVVSGNAIAKYMNDGYTSTGVNIDGNILTMLFIAPDSSDYVQVSATLTPEEYDAYNALDFFAADYDQQEKDFLSNLPGEITVTVLNDRVPSDEVLNRFVGMTLAELKSEGFDQTSMVNGNDDMITFIFSNEEMNIMVYPEGGYKDLFSLSDVDLDSLVIARVQFYGFPLNG